MILDTSPLIAILAKEPDSERYVDAISHAPRCRMSAGNFLELSPACFRIPGKDRLVAVFGFRPQQPHPAVPARIAESAEAFSRPTRLPL